MTMTWRVEISDDLKKAIALLEEAQAVKELSLVEARAAAHAEIVKVVDEVLLPLVKLYGKELVGYRIVGPGASDQNTLLTAVFRQGVESKYPRRDLPTPVPPHPESKR